MKSSFGQAAVVARRLFDLHAVMTAAAVLLLTGCGGEDSSSSETGNRSYEIKQIDVAKLPIGDPLPPGVSKELRVSAPQEWMVPGRKSGYITWFLRWESSHVPLIALQESEAIFAAADTINEENVVEYAQVVCDRLEEGGKEPIEEVLIVQFGDRFYVRYVLKGRVGGTIMERQILETQANGKTYKVELRVLPGKLLDSRDAGYAVAASIEFLSEAVTEETQSPPVDPDANPIED